ncbi:MAG: helix-turn-helix domain-containing protein [Candidatus Woesearchaeota archaeon]|jgi:predicted DNA binding protein
MWVLKLKLSCENFLLGSLAHKFNVDLTGYSLGYYKDKNNLYLTTAGLIIGDDKNKKKVINYLKKNKQFVYFETNGDFIVNVSKQPLYLEPVYNPKFIRSSPDFISREGYHIWEIASWRKDDLLPVIDIAKKYYGGKILKLKKEKLTTISFTSFLPDLSDKQKEAFDLANAEGYYFFPRKTNMHKLAKIMKVSYSTYQEHLRKAESKLIPDLKRK